MRYPVAINWCENCKFVKTCGLTHHNIARKKDCAHYKEGPPIVPRKFTGKSVPGDVKKNNPASSSRFIRGQRSVRA